MRRIVSVTIAVALLSFTLVSCGGGNDAPTVSNSAPFVGEKFTLSGSVDADGSRSVVLQSFDEGWSEVAKAETTTDGGYTFTTSTDGADRSATAWSPPQRVISSSTSPRR